MARKTKREAEEKAKADADRIALQEYRAEQAAKKQAAMTSTRSS